MRKKIVIGLMIVVLLFTLACIGGGDGGGDADPTPTSYLAIPAGTIVIAPPDEPTAVILPLE